MANQEDLSDAIKFTKNDADPKLPGKSHHTLSVFQQDNTIRFRDSRSMAGLRPDQTGRVRLLESTVFATFQIKKPMYRVIHHTAVGSNWSTLLQLRPGYAFSIDEGIIPPSVIPSAHLNHDMLKLWSQKTAIQARQYMQIVVHNFDTYPPWKILLQKEALGPPLASARSFTIPLAPPLALAPARAPTITAAAVSVRATDDTPLIDFSADNDAAAPAAASVSSGAQGGLFAFFYAAQQGGKDGELGGVEQVDEVEQDEQDNQNEQGGEQGDEEPEEHGIESEPESSEEKQQEVEQEAGGDGGDSCDSEESGGSAHLLPSPLDPFAGLWDLARSR